MLNGIHERDMNKDENIKVKIRKYQTQFTEITKTNYNTWWQEWHIQQYQLLKETCKDTKLRFSSVICRTDVKDIIDTINTTNFHVENYCKQQNVGFINNYNIKKSDLNSKGLHLNEHGSSKLAKNLLDFIY